jgi:hypothetical protein
MLEVLWHRHKKHWPRVASTSGKFMGMVIPVIEICFEQGGSKGMARLDETVNGETNGMVIHLVLRGKGGVGKSVVATWLAEYHEQLHSCRI